jgi:poly-gamma-glutamate capsule biosynthesis protein CapA/YwtB (metallophosphatase superfamily)
MTVSVLAAGDVFPALPDGGLSFAPLRPVLQAADIVFGNCEGVYSDRPARAPSHKHFMGTARAHAECLGAVPFHVMTLANNHMIDGGYVGLSDTIEVLSEQGISTTGAGEDIDAALKPAILARDGVRVAFLGFCTVYPVGYEARPDRPGLAPLRVRTHYSDPDPNFWEPGIEPVTTTSAMPEDLARYRAAIASAREQADFVIVACHWGYSSWLETIQDYELELARDAVDHGADAVVCHHTHSLRGIEIHRGKPIFYGLGALVHHFVSFETSHGTRAEREARYGERSSFSAEDVFELWPFRPATRRTGLAAIDLGPNGEVSAGFVPAYMLSDGSTEPLRPDDPRATEIADYVEQMSRDCGFATRFTRAERDGWFELRAGGA